MAQSVLTYKGGKKFSRNNVLQSVFGQILKLLSPANIPSERASQGEQNGADFRFVAPSSEEL